MMKTVALYFIFKRRRFFLWWPIEIQDESHPRQQRKKYMVCGCFVQKLMQI